MTEHVVRIFALIYQQIAILEGMRAENQVCQVREETPAFREEHFNFVADELDRLSGSL